MIRTVIEFSLRLRTLIVAFAAVLVAAGVWHMRSVPLDVVPEFSPIKLIVKTEALGLSSTEVESLITVPIEADLLNGVPWLQTIQSESMTGLSSIEMTFAPGTDYMRARQMVQERLVQAHALPNVSRPPTLLQPVSSTGRLMNIGLSSKTVSPIEMSVMARWTIVPRLLGVPGVANVAVWGQRDRQLQVMVDPKTMREKGVTLEQVVKTAGEAVWASPLTYLNSSTPGTGGFIDTPNQRLNIRHQAPITTPKDFARVPVHGTSIALGEVAKVVEGHQPLIGDALLKDGPGLILVVDKFPGFNTQDVTRDLEAALRELKPGMTGIDVDMGIYRPASFIDRAAGNLSGALLAAGVLLVIGLVVLLGSWQSALVAGVTIALSLLAALLVLNLRGINFNMLVLAGLLAAIGAVVHDAILTASTIRRRIDDAWRGPTRRHSGRIILEAVVETRRPMMYATLITVIAVIPILFMQGLSAAFFGPLIWSYIAAVVAAMVVSLVVAPALSLMLLPPSLGGGQQAPAPAPSPVPALLAPWLRLYERWLGSTVRSAAIPYGIAVVALGLSYAIWTSLERNMLPTFRETDVVIDVQSAPGTSLPAMNRATASLMRDLQAVRGVRNVAALVGRAVLCNCDETADVNSAELWVSIDPAANHGAALAAIEEVVDSAVGITGEVQTYLSKKMREALTGREETLTVRVYGHELEIIQAKAEEIRRILGKINGVEDPRIEQAAAEPTLEVEVDLDRASRYGLKPGDIRRATSAMVSGITVGALFQEQKVFDVVVWGAPEVRNNLSDIQGLMIDTEDDEQVRLGDVAHVRIGQSNSVIRRQGVLQAHRCRCRRQRASAERRDARGGAADQRRQVPVRIPRPGPWRACRAALGASEHLCPSGCGGGADLPVAAGGHGQLAAGCALDLGDTGCPVRRAPGRSSRGRDLLAWFAARLCHGPRAHRSQRDHDGEASPGSGAWRRGAVRRGAGSARCAGAVPSCHRDGDRGRPGGPAVRGARKHCRPGNRASDGGRDPGRGCHVYAGDPGHDPGPLPEVRRHHRGRRTAS